MELLGGVEGQGSVSVKCTYWELQPNLYHPIAPTELLLPTLGNGFACSLLH